MLEAPSNLVSVSHQHATHHILGQKGSSPTLRTYGYRSQHMLQGDHIASCVIQTLRRHNCEAPLIFNRSNHQQFYHFAPFGEVCFRNLGHCKSMPQLCEQIQGYGSLYSSTIFAYIAPRTYQSNGSKLRGPRLEANYHPNHLLNTIMGLQGKKKTSLEEVLCVSM